MNQLIIHIVIGLILGLGSLSSTLAASSCSKREIEASLFLQRKYEPLRLHTHRATLADWIANTNVTDENMQKKNEILAQNAAFNKALAEELLELGYQHLEDDNIHRQVKILTRLGFDVLPKEEHLELHSAISAMQKNYATLKVCSFKDKEKCDLTLEPHIQERLKESRDPEELQYYWKAFYDKAGTPMRENFKKYVTLSRKAAKLNDFNSYAEDWIEKYDDQNFEDNLDRVYELILPFYKELHGYVRYKLREHYGNKVVAERGNIPMHLLGNMWGQSWEEVVDLFTPYPEKPYVDVTSEMVRQGLTPVKIFQLGDEFFQSLNMTKLPEIFWKESVLERPTDREVVCHASAWDLYETDDVRIKQCTEVTTRYLYIAHHELGHIQYYLQYQHQPIPFRQAPNPGFHEAVGDVIALSVATPKHLAKIGLIKSGELDEKSRINELFKNAVKKVAFLPFGYTMDKYRYAVFRGDLNETNWNCGFWRMRSQHGGIEPAVDRSENDFDPPAKYHVSADVEYLRYFAAHIFQFQFHKAMCKKAGQYVEGDPNLTLDQCDVHGSAEAGNSFKEMLSSGALKHWKDALEGFTGKREMDPTALLQYFAPLRVWLKAEIERLNIPLGWEVTQKCKSS
ncbi:angiotensin-converting enzyme-related protein-like [Episyrphus balteatus]|uniref:angiotensin-converting enzyme-related protein-like n=1 Tax=Episyrphus balteatus TaxID=286459 RepID=UPI0024852413|nr:angiotensin-converting enzyme-related protein-like [Episyrphus balteatus]